MTDRPGATLDRLDAEFRLMLGQPPRPAPAALVGVEQEFSLRMSGEPVDFRRIIHDLPVDGRLLDPGDPNAYRLAWGGSLTSDGNEAEVATPPVPRRAGFATTLDVLSRRGRDELEGLLDTLPEPILADGYSTHVSVAMPDELNERVCRLYASTFAPALMLLMDRAESPGLIVRPRPGRAELCGEFVAGRHLRAVSAFAAGSARACAAGLSGLRASRRRLPPRLRVAVAPATIRYGWFVDRRAFGPDLYDRGRQAVLRRRWGGTITAQDQLELAWEAAREALGDDVDPSDLEAADALVAGTLALPVEGGRDDARDHRMAAEAADDIPFRELITVRDRPAFAVRPAVATWDFTVFEVAATDGAGAAGVVTAEGRTGVVTVPRDAMPAFVRGLDGGRFDPVIAAYLVEPPAGRGSWRSSRRRGLPGCTTASGSPPTSCRSNRRPARAPRRRRARSAPASTTGTATASSNSSPAPGSPAGSDASPPGRSSRPGWRPRRWRPPWWWRSHPGASRSRRSCRPPPPRRRRRPSRRRPSLRRLNPRRHPRRHPRRRRCPTPSRTPLRSGRSR